MEKTNVMRILDQRKIKHNEYTYPHNNEAVDGLDVAKMLNQDPNRVFKTLVGRGKKTYMFMIPVSHTLDLKRAAIMTNEKKIELVHVNELLELTGYVRGGCSPIGMKKNFKTFCHKSALDFDMIIFSAGRIGFQVEMNARELEKICNISFCEIIEE